MFPRTAHFPRVTIDRLVVSGEQWRFSGREVPLATCRDPGERFITARRWARQQRFPRWVFVRVPVERKPLYVDFHSPPSVDILTKVMRRAIQRNESIPVSLTEMLPNPRQCWLVDHAGRRYSSELRVVAVDEQPWRPFWAP